MTTKKKTVKKKARSTVKKTGATVKKKKVTKKKSRTVKTAPAKSAKTNKATKPEAEAPKQELNNSLKLDSVLVINNAKSLLQDISKLVESNQNISIDASSVEMIDTAILQLLLAATIKTRSAGHIIRWINPSDKFIANASLLGLSESLGIE